MDAYLTAWESNDPDDIRALVTDDVDYRNEPWTEPWHGADAVVEGWLARCALGDRAALGLLYAATSAKLFGVALRVLGDRPEAEDALVDYFRCISGEHPDWDGYRAAMRLQDKSLIRITPTRWGPIATCGFPADVAARLDG